MAASRWLRNASECWKVGGPVATVFAFSKTPWGERQRKPGMGKKGYYRSLNKKKPGIGITVVTMWTMYIYIYIFGCF